MGKHCVDNSYVLLLGQLAAAADLFQVGQGRHVLDERCLEGGSEADLAVDLDLVELLATAHHALVLHAHAGYNALPVEDVAALQLESRVGLEAHAADVLQLLVEVVTVDLPT